MLKSKLFVLENLYAFYAQIGVTMDILKTLAAEFGIKEEQVKETVALIDEGNTIPFISRYRKEVTGGLDDATLRDLNDRLNYLRKISSRRSSILRR